MPRREQPVRDIANDLNDLPNNIATRAVGCVLEQISHRRADLCLCLAIAREIEAKNTAAGALGNIANVLDDMGQLEEARKKQQEGLQAFREVGNKRGEGSTLSNLANLLAELGDLEGAKQGYNEALKIVVNSKTQRTSVCNAAESLVVHADVAGEFLCALIYILLGRVFSDRVVSLDELVGDLSWALVALIAAALIGWKLYRSARFQSP